MSVIKKLYADVTGCSNIRSVNVATSHSSSVATAQIECLTTTLDVGDEITVDMGFTTNHDQIFTGFVKNVNRKVPTNVWTITASDVMIRAIDFFVVSTNPNDKFSRHNIKAEDLVRDVLALAHLTDFEYTPTQFTFAVTDGVNAEVHLVSAYDYCKMIADLLAWHLYADQAGTIHFINRKPYVMDGNSGQPGDIADTVLKTIDSTSNFQILNFDIRKSDRDLRNRVVVHGSDGVFAEAKVSSPYLPDADYYKTIALISPIIDNQGMAQSAADYNLDLYNRLTEQVSAQIEGDPEILARTVVTVDESITSTSGDWYVYLAEHNLGAEGYTTTLELRR